MYTLTYPAEPTAGQGGLEWPRHTHRWLAMGLSLALHAAVLWLVSGTVEPTTQRQDPIPADPADPPVVFMEWVPPTPAAINPLPPAAAQLPTARLAAPTPAQAPAMAIATAPPPADPPAPPAHTPVTQDAPPAPSAEDWALAARYTLKNSKAYRHTWAQQVRSMMGTAVEGPEQGQVRFRITIAPDGRLATLETLWSTSAVAEHKARQAVAALPALPPTPTGQPLVFEKTLSFSPFASDDRPIYKNDCEPDPPAHHNRFVWDGRSPPPSAAPPARPEPPLDAQALAECLKQLPPDTVEAEAAHDRRQLEQWRSGNLGR